MRNNTKLLITVLIICALVFLAPVEGKKKKSKMGGMGGMGGGGGGRKLLFYSNYILNSLR